MQRPARRGSWSTASRLNARSSPNPLVRCKNVPCLRVHPSGNYGIVSIGANCNWDIYCHDSISTTGGTPDLQTTLLRVELNSATTQKGRVSVAARGIRNAIGLWFDPHGNLLFTSHGSDRASGITGATSANNIPDCTLELLRFHEEDEVLVARSSGFSKSR